MFLKKEPIPSTLRDEFIAELNKNKGDYNMEKVCCKKCGEPYGVKASMEDLDLDTSCKINKNIRIVDIKKLKDKINSVFKHTKRRVYNPVTDRYYDVKNDYYSNLKKEILKLLEE